MAQRSFLQPIWSATGHLQRRIWMLLDASRVESKWERVVHSLLLFLILANTAAVILESVRSIGTRFAAFFFWFEVFSVIIFTFEYAARIWSCVTEPKYSRPIVGRIRFFFQPMTLIDLLAILTFYLPAMKLDLRYVRALRLLRIFRIAKAVRYSRSLRLLGNVLKDKREELILTFAVVLVLLVLASSLMYAAEHEVQPDKIPDIPSAMWWAIATLTTVGYGDIYPVTGIGKVLASIVAVIGIGLFALPAGILGAGFIEEIQKQKGGSILCPHCGQDISVPPGDHHT